MEWERSAVFSINSEAEEGAEDRYDFETHNPHDDPESLSMLIDSVYEEGESQEIPDIEYDTFYNEAAIISNCIVYERDGYYACILEMEDGTNLLYTMDEADDIEEEEFEEDGLE